jgi:diguanylate cyclase (GGDEF)-like protein
MIDCYTPTRNGLLGVADWLVATSTNASKLQILALGGAAVAVVALINYLFGPAPCFGPFYMFIICLLTWALGARAGLMIGFACMGLGLTLNGFSLYTSDHFTVGWTIGTRMAAVILVIALVAMFRRSYIREWTRARTDFLTGALTKRAYLEDRARRTSKASWRVLAYLDLDKFKEVNDTQGHAEGDAVLSLFATNLIGCIRSSDTLARLGGDEFLLDIWVKTEGDARAAMRSIHSRLTDALHVNGHKLGCSVGALLIPPRGRAVGEIEIGITDQLMYQAKRDRLREPLIAIHSTSGEPSHAIEHPTTLTPQRHAA